MRQVPMNIHDFALKKAQNQKISMITCYDYPSARTIAESDIDCVLVGDSVAMTVHGHNSTIMATIEMMQLHTAAVAKGISHQFIVSDMPFLAHRKSLHHSVDNAQKLLQAGAHAIKIEGGDQHTYDTIRHLVQAGVPVMGHIGLTPQAVNQLGGYKVQGKTTNQANELAIQAKSLEAAGCFAIVIECVPKNVAQTITQQLIIPVIGIGAGAETDGQVLVWHDLLGLQNDIRPRFVKQFYQGKQQLLNAINQYTNEVRTSTFPSTEHTY